MSTIRELDQVVLAVDLPTEGLVVGDLGTVVLIYREGQAYEVEFMTLEGKTVAVVTLEASQIRLVGQREIVHARELASRYPLTRHVITSARCSAGPCGRINGASQKSK